MISQHFSLMSIVGEIETQKEGNKLQTVLAFLNLSLLINRNVVW